MDRRRHLPSRTPRPAAPSRGRGCSARAASPPQGRGWADTLGGSGGLRGGPPADQEDGLAPSGPAVGGSGGAGKGSVSRPLLLPDSAAGGRGARRPADVGSSLGPDVGGVAIGAR